MEKKGNLGLFSEALAHMDFFLGLPIEASAKMGGFSGCRYSPASSARLPKRSEGWAQTDRSIPAAICASAKDLLFILTSQGL
jgi:hypothetical protein